MRRSHTARDTTDKSPNGPTVRKTSAARATEGDLSRGERVTGWRRARTLAAVAVALAALVGLAWLERRSVRDSFTVLSRAHLSLLPFAISAEILSMAARARLQRRLLGAGGVRLSMPAVVVIIYASNAISVSIPIAGAP